MHCKKTIRHLIRTCQLVSMNNTRNGKWRRVYTPLPPHARMLRCGRKCIFTWLRHTHTYCISTARVHKQMFCCRAAWCDYRASPAAVAGSRWDGVINLWRGGGAGQTERRTARHVGAERDRVCHLFTVRAAHVFGAAPICHFYIAVQLSESGM